MKRHLSSGAMRRPSRWQFFAIGALGGALFLSGCGGGEPVDSAPAEEPAPAAPPPTEPEREPEPQPEPQPGPDISEVRVPADHPVWSPDHAGVLLGLDGRLYEGPSRATAARVQQALVDQGFYHGEVDSDFDRETMEAVADFQAEHDLRPTGVPTSQTRSVIRPAADESPVQPERGFVVQVGVFRNPANSERLAQGLTELSFQVQTQSTGEGLRIVRVGPFQDRAAAEEAARAIAEATNLSPLVMRN